MQNAQEIKHRWAPTLGALEDTAENIWGTTQYDPVKDADKPCVFFGCYGFPDFQALWKHRGKKWILWAGTDITHFCNGYWLDYKGEIRVDPRPLAQWIKKNCESWVENEVEARALRTLGIESSICPSFLGDIDKYPITYKQSSMPKVYASVSGNNFELYGWPLIEKVAPQTPRVTYYLYGNTTEWKTKHSNVIVRGRVSKEEMNDEIRGMQAGLRFTKEMDGASEIMVKSGLWGQWPIVYRAYSYPFVSSFAHEDELAQLLNALRYRESPNIKFRNWLKGNLNNYPFNLKK